MLIVDMKMPATCEKCKLNSCMFYKREWQTVDGTKTWRNARADGCLIKGDLLDSELEALNNLEEFEWCDTCKEYDQEAHCCHRWSKVINNTVKEIKNHTGFWEKVGDYFRCSDCRTEFKEMPTVMGKPVYKFCPECGVRLELEVN